MIQATPIRTAVQMLFEGQGAALYGGERVTQLEHALQAAHLAEQAGEASPMILASLLHDVGHFFERDFDAALSSQHDARHEHIGARYLGREFGPELTEPIRLHVEAKRYLCATRPGYFEQLSPASVHSLSLQGGPMTADQIQTFERLPFHTHAVRLREYDDKAKVPGARTPDLNHFLSLIA